MNFKRFGRPAVIAIAAGLALSSCAANEGAAPASDEASASTLTGTLNGAGASSMDAAQQAWIAGFQTANPAVTINYEPSGSGGGREAFIAGGTDFAGSDSYMSADELAGTFKSCAPDSKAVDLPVYISPIAVIFNVDGLTDLNIDADTLAKIFSGAITSWDDAAIAKLNPDATLPATAIAAVHRSDDSGTTKNFTDYLGKAASDVWTEKASDTFPFPGEGAKGTSGVVDAVTNGVGTIGYADASQAGKLSTAKLMVGTDFVAYTPEAAAEVVAGSPLVPDRAADDLALDLNRKTTNPAEYPLVLVSYAIVCNEYADPAKGELVKAYIEYIASAAGQTVAEGAAGVAPLTSELETKVAAVLATVK
ncbi:phosphate transport system substrate-binding protein [Cryobacterium flavum]|uniref:Phosphate-binding protein n=1 Tax=Cryobacterium flavum TaxID=1424659 RepID=A0A4V3I8W6_9MICO|nr:MULTISPECIES: phosphate ABC transporter substrate-binding protein PstS [Cryobacterium]TFB76655.1 phosphate ABC transporter substrate-binding protein PstS [Cryobacterium flavum]TFD05089.1 phosphate ABC transporter substrate-binding protein PstS [Cryobacterium sp. TMT1-66-1]TFD09752.1 phosphate ABC transporter substrate-binding protein PstS [Cryobacterium sp. TMT1-2-2]SDO27777.1 phosphate transport system substrate-binding protein [Cryobacterium flavum]